MANLKVYEVEATIMLRRSFEVDAVNKSNAHEVATAQLEQEMAFISRDRCDSYDIDIEQVEESEGH